MKFAAMLLIPLVTLTAAAGSVGWDDALRQPAAWYAGAEAVAMADSVLLYQTDAGGWPKNRDFAEPPDAAFLADAQAGRHAATIDNQATTTPLRFLARMVAATGDDRYRAAFGRGVDYLLAAQYDNGGWPQFYPLLKGYHTHITYNDDAMVAVLTLLRDAARAEQPYGFLDAERRARAAAAVAKGIACILRTQVRQEGRLTAWCAQHDVETLRPAWARNFEPPSLSGCESVGIVRFLMSIERPSDEIVAAVEGAVAWFREVKIEGLRIEAFTDADGMPDRRVVADSEAGPLWARFYELGTNRPIFAGRDKVVRHAYAGIERERRAGYAYYGTWPARLLERDYPEWRARIGRE